MDDVYKSESIKTLEHIISNLPGNIYLKDRNDVYLWVNENCAKIFDMTPADIIGKRGDEFIEKENAKITRHIDEQIYAKGKVVTLYEEGYDNNGNKTVYLSRKIPLKENGKFCKLLGVSINVTGQLKTQPLKTKSAKEAPTLPGADIAGEIKLPLEELKLHSDLLNQLLTDLFQSYNIAIENNLLKSINLEKDTPLQKKILDDLSKAFEVY